MACEMKERVHRLKSVVRTRNEFVTGAARVSAGKPEPCLHRRRSAIDGVAEDVLGINRAAFARRDVAAVEACGGALLDRGVWQQIAGQLLNAGFIEPFVAVEGIYDPLSVRPHLAAAFEV